MELVPAFSNPLSIRKSLRIAFVLAALSAVLYLPVSTKLAQATAPPTGNSPAAKTFQMASPGTPSGTTISVTVSNCTPLIFGAPAEMDLAAQAAGFTMQTDPTKQYRVYGDNIETLRSQIQRCAPRATADSKPAEFAAETSYRLSWDYTVDRNGDSCRLDGVKVGLRTVTAVPSWQPSSSSPASMSNLWQQFISGVTVHENGHVNLDKTYGQQLYTDLTNMVGIPCSNIADLARAVVNDDVAVLNHANENYDALTQNGVTQGAVLPND